METDTPNRGLSGRPDMSPSHRARPFFESELIGIGVVHYPAGHPEWKSDRTGLCWPAIGLPRIPYELRVEGGAPFVTDRNTVFFTNVGSTYRRRVLTERGLENDWVDIRPELLAEMLTAATGIGHEPTSRFPWTSGPSPTSPLLRVHALNSVLAEGQSGHSLRIEETVLSVIAEIIAENVRARATIRRRRMSAAQEKYQRDAVEEIRRTLAVEPERTHSLAQLAAKVHMSPFHLCRVFKKCTGLPVHKYQERLRLRHALAWVLDSKKPMIHVAARLGFCSEAHLSNAFVKEFGIRPSRMRRDREGVLAGADQLRA